MTRLQVVDASVAIAWYSLETETRRAQALLRAGDDLAAPDIVLAEIANALRRKQRSGQLTAQTVRNAVGSATQTFVSLVPTDMAIADALELSQALDHSIYDCLYLAVGRLLDAPLITLDRKFVGKLAGTSDAGRVMHLHDWSPT